MSRATDPTDAVLLDRFIRGDLRAFADLVERYQKPVFNFVRRLVVSPEETFMPVVRYRMDGDSEVAC